MSCDRLIKNGTVVVGSGAPRFLADFAIRDGRIVKIGRISGTAPQTINADGPIVAPSFIDGRTHMDAQDACDPLGSCSCWHGVIGVPMGNCGFALAPYKPETREWYARCREAVDNIEPDIRGRPGDRQLFGPSHQGTACHEHIKTLHRRVVSKSTSWEFS